MNHVELFFGCPWCLKACLSQDEKLLISNGSKLRTMAVGSIPTCNWAHPIRLGLFALGHQSLLHYLLVSFPMFGSWVESCFFVIIFKLMFGGLYLHLSVRHISICVLMCVAYPLFVLCNYHLAHYNSHFSWGLEEEVNIRSLVGHKSKMISTC